jgi:hypothetical protein
MLRRKDKALLISRPKYLILILVGLNACGLSYDQTIIPCRDSLIHNPDHNLPANPDENRLHYDKNVKNVCLAIFDKTMLIIGITSSSTTSSRTYE